jgi:dTDP-4-amino-4,6-dideoxygalactose transaminase
MIVTDDERLADEIRYLATQARDHVPHYEHRAVRYNYRLSNLLAELGRGQLLSLAERVKRRRDNYFFYQAELGVLPGISMMPHADYGEPNCWLSCMLINREEFGIGPPEVRQHLDRQDIEAQPAWKPMHLQPIYRGARMLSGAVCEDIYRRGLCLLSGSSLSDADRERVVAAVSGVPGRKW